MVSFLNSYILYTTMESYVQNFYTFDNPLHLKGINTLFMYNDHVVQDDRANPFLRAIYL